MSLSRFLSITSAIVLAGCPGDDDCGPRGASASGLTASSAEVTIVYENLTWLLGNDCPDPMAPSGVVSMSIEGRQTGGGTGLVTFCIPRPDLLTSGTARTLGTSLSMADVRIFDLSGSVDGCEWEFDSSRPPTGQTTGLGVCGDGLDPAGFALDLDGAVSLRKAMIQPPTCTSTITTVAVTLVGRVAVAKRPE
jgi:hypothetical protein